MIIASFNANGIRARLGIVLDWLKNNSPDVLCIQETKVQDHEFPLKPLEGQGYHCCYKGQKSYNGVAVISRERPRNVFYGFGDGNDTEEARLITVEIDGLSIVNTYVPQGQAPESDKFNYKIFWLERLKNFFDRRFDPLQPLVWVGDFNVAPLPIDVYDPEKLLGSVGYHPLEHQTLKSLAKWGFIDVYRFHNPNEKSYTFWDYRIPQAVNRGLGWRVDHIWATEQLAAQSTGAWIDTESRLLPKPSDHTFIVATF